MKYVCVLVSKETVDKQVFNTKQEVIDFFEERFGQEVRAEANKKLVSLRKRLANQETEYTGTMEQDEKLDKTNKEIDAQLRIIHNPVTQYSKRMDPWKNCPASEEPKEILHVGSIYCRPGRYEFLEDKHYVTLQELEYEGDAKNLCKEIYFQHKDKSHTIYILNGEDMRDRAIKKVVKLRNQIARDYKKESTRL